MTAKIFIDGEAGTTGLQIRERLAGRDDLELLSIPDEKRKDLSARQELLNAADVAILCLPDDAAKESVSLIENQTTRVIDASTAHRVNPIWTYGFAEMTEGQARKIADARFVANPGCWPQGLIAAIRPLVDAGLYPDDHRFGELMLTGISGYSGGGKSMIADYESKGDQAPAVMPYALQFNHKHIPEMEQFSRYGRPLFVPTVGSFYQGMLEIIPVPVSPKLPSAEDIHSVLDAHYGSLTNSFVKVQPLEDVNRVDTLDPQSLNGTNELHLHVFGGKDQPVVFAVYDNLGKGASGAAVQNLNLMLGAEPGTGL